MSGLWPSLSPSLSPTWCGLLTAARCEIITSPALSRWEGGRYWEETPVLLCAVTKYRLDNDRADQAGTSSWTLVLETQPAGFPMGPSRISGLVPLPQASLCWLCPLCGIGRGLPQAEGDPSLPLTPSPWSDGPPPHPFWKALVGTGEIPALPPPGLRLLCPRLIINGLSAPAQLQPHPPMSEDREKPGKGAMRKKPRTGHTPTCPPPPAAHPLSARRALGPGAVVALPDHSGLRG